MHDMPLVKAITEYINQKNIPFHMPGHRQGKLLDMGFPVLAGDLTELPGLDDLHLPSGCIKEAERMAAAAFGSDETMFCVNGSSGSILAAISGSTQPGDYLVVDRNCHKSVINALALARVNPVFVCGRFHQRYNCVLPADPSEYLDAVISSNAKGVLITRPDYYGICGNIRRLSDELHDMKRFLIVDEAHGAHMRFADNMPECAASFNSDIIIHSAHKTLPAMNQASLLHVNGPFIDSGRIRRSLSIFQTTSPSYPIMASIDYARSWLQSFGQSAYKPLEAAIRDLTDFIIRSDSITINPSLPDCERDWSRLVLSCSGFSGYELGNYLRRNGIQPEMCDFDTVLFITVPGDEKYFPFLKKTLAAFPEKNNPVYRKYNTPISLPSALKPGLCTGLYDAIFGDSHLVSLSSAEGRISSESIAPYPPGIPIIIPGEKFTKKIIEMLYNVLKTGCDIHGIYTDKYKEGGVNVLRNMKMPAYKGFFLSVEGMDGSGKTTQLKNIREYLNDKNYDVLFLREPGGTAIGEKIRAVLLDRDNTEMTPETELFLYAASRAQIVKEVIIPALEAGTVVICDRYVHSAYAFQGFGRNLGYDTVKTINDTATTGLEPDLTLFLDITPERSLKRSFTRGDPDRLESESTGFHRRVYEGYKYIAGLQPDKIKVINADRDIDDVTAEVIKIISGYLP